MARLRNEEVLALLKKPKNKSAIARCAAHHHRLRYHVQPVDTQEELSPYHNVIMSWVKLLLPDDKYLQFEKFYRTPVPTVEIAERIFTQIERSLNADNQVIKVDFNNPEYTSDFEAFRIDTGDTTFWKTDAYEAVQTAVNTLIVVDLPQQQLTDRPEPYNYLLEIKPSSVHDVEFNKDGVAEYVIFDIGSDRKAAFDDEFYRIYRKEDKTTRYVLEKEVRHSFYDENGKLTAGLGYTPARRLWDDLLIGQSNRVQAKNPLSKLLGKLDEYIFDLVSLRYYKSYGTWPILWEYENKKPMHQHPQIADLKCQGKYFIVPQPDTVGLGGVRVPQRAIVEECAECKKSGYTGPGTIKRVTPPQKNVDPDLRNPVGWISPDPNIIAHATKELEKAKVALIESAVGSGGETDTTQARNEKDVQSGFEVTQSYLLNFNKNMAAAQKWALQTRAILRYGRNELRSVTVDLGDQFFLRTEEEIKSEYKSSKEAGLPDYLLAPILELLAETKFKNNDEQRARMRILANLQPYPNKTDKELQDWLTVSPHTLNATLLRLRMNFHSYLLRFEREQEMGIIDFASDISFDRKINIIRAELVRYVNEDFKGENILVPVSVAPLVKEEEKEKEPLTIS